MIIQRTAPCVQYDSGDISEQGNWRGAEVGCLDCREVAPMQITIASRWTLALVCGECGQHFTEVRA